MIYNIENMISVIIPHYDDISLLQEHLPKLTKLLSASKLEFEVIVSDDASPVGVVAELRKLQKIYPAISFILKEQNEGFGPSVNRAVKQARGEFVFVLKNDTLPARADFFALLLKHFADPQVFAVSAASQTEEDGQPEIRGQGIIIFFRGFFLHFRTRSDYGKWLLTSRSTRSLGEKLSANTQSEAPGTKHSAWADGGSSVFRREVFLKLGGFNQVYAPFYWEDTDLGYLAWKAGYTIDFEPQALLVHEHRQGTIARHYSAKALKILNIRNQFNFVWSNGDGEHLLQHFFWYPYHFLVALKNRNWTYFQGQFVSILKIPGLLAVRAQRKGLVNRSDSDVLKEFEVIQ